MVLKYTSHMHKQLRLPGPILDTGLLIVTMFNGNMDKAQRQQNDKQSTHSRSSASIAMLQIGKWMWGETTGVLFMFKCPLWNTVASLYPWGQATKPSLAKHSFDLCLPCYAQNISNCIWMTKCDQMRPTSFCFAEVYCGISKLCVCIVKIHA